MYLPVNMSFLSRGSSPVDWCEDNYTLSQDIAEFFNTVSNLSFIFIGVASLLLFRNYVREIHSQVNIVWMMYLLVGISSAYFHSTLSLLGQLCDEMSIVWLLATAMAFWWSKTRYPQCLNESRCKFQSLIFILTVITTALCLMYPWINAFVLMFFVIPVFYHIRAELRSSTDKRAKRLTIEATVLAIVAYTCWIIDRSFCPFWLSINFVYLHAIWHLLIGISGCYVIVLSSYHFALIKNSHKFPSIKFWPVDAFGVGIPYVSVDDWITRL